MKRQNPTLRVACATYIPTVLLSAMLGACGGGGGETSSSASNPVSPTDTSISTDTTRATLVGQRHALSSDPKVRDQQVKSDAQASTVYIETNGTQVTPVGLTGVTTLSRFRGSGFIMTHEGHVVTNAHVVRGSGLYTVQVEGRNQPISAELVAVAECEDLAVLRMVSGAPFPPLSWHANAPTLSTKVGAAGFPADVYATSDPTPYVFTEGVINTEVLHEDNQWSSADMFLHSATISGGSSGGPLIELDTGTVVGVNYAGSTSRNMALSGTTARSIIDQLLQGQDVLSIGFSGEMFYRYYDAGSKLVGYGLASQVPTGTTTRLPVGVWVRGVAAGGKAKRAGVLPGDIITAVAGVRLDRSDNTMGSYCNALRSNNPNTAGRVLDIEIVRPKAGGVVCTGEINGRLLGPKSTPSSACPEAAVAQTFKGAVTGPNMNHSLTIQITNGVVTGTGTWADGTRALNGTLTSAGVLTMNEVVTTRRTLYYYGTYDANTKAFSGSLNDLINGQDSPGTWVASFSQ